MSAMWVKIKNTLPHILDDDTSCMSNKEKSEGRAGQGRAGKAFTISKRPVWEAYKRVKANNGAGGVDRQTIDKLNGHLKEKNTRTAKITYLLLNPELAYIVPSNTKARIRSGANWTHFYVVFLQK